MRRFLTTILGLLGMVIAAIIIFVILANYIAPNQGALTSVDPYREGKEGAAYSSFQSYMRSAGYGDLEFQPYQFSIATYEGNDIWHFRFYVKLVNKKMIYDVRYRSKPNNQWEEIKAP
jgi:hypothetical protein